MTPSLARTLLAALALAAGALAAAPASAYPVTAQIDEQIKPNFGILLHPPAFRHHYHQGIWYGRRRGWGRGYIESYGRPYGERYEDRQPYQPGASSITVDCGDASYGPNPISDAATYVPDGGVVYVRGHGQVCHETIEIDHPVAITTRARPGSTEKAETSSAAITTGWSISMVSWQTWPWPRT